jgi:hypothetical protein
MTKLMSFKEFVKFCKVHSLVVKVDINTDSYEPSFISGYCSDPGDANVPKYLGYQENQEVPLGPNKLYVIKNCDEEIPSRLTSLEELLGKALKHNWKISMDRSSYRTLRVTVSDVEGFEDVLYLDIITGKLDIDSDEGDK